MQSLTESESLVLGCHHVIDRSAHDFSGPPQCSDRIIPPVQTSVPSFIATDGTRTRVRGGCTSCAGSLSLGTLFTR